MRVGNVKNPFKPRKVGCIRQKKEIEAGRNIVLTIENLGDDEYVCIDRILSYREAKRFWKYADQVNVPIHVSDDIQYLIRYGIKNADDGPKRGYGWFGQNPPNHKIFPLKEAIEGLELYTLYKNKIKLEDYGNRVLANVPSREKRIEHKVRLESVPTKSDEDPFKHVVNISAQCDCEFNLYTRLGHKYRLPEDIFCAHAVASIFKSAEIKKAKRRPKFAKSINLTQSPVLIAREPLIDFYDKLRCNVLIKHKVRRVPSQAEIEILLWRYVFMCKNSIDKLFNFDSSALSAEYADYAVKFIS